VEAAAGVPDRGRPALSLADIERINRPPEMEEDEDDGEGMGAFGGMFGSCADDDEEEAAVEEAEGSPALPVAAAAAAGNGVLHDVHPPSLLPGYALEVQTPWSRRLLDGSKTIETRAYPLLPAVLEQPVLLIESPEGGGLAAHGLGAGRAVGIVVYGGSRRYATRQEWAADAGRHGVDPAAPPEAFGWREEGGKKEEEKWGWEVVSVDAWPAERCRAFPLREEQRLHRSIFRLS
jgi:hypothetical protein